MDLNSTTASIGVDFYVILIVILSLLFIVSWLNERCRHANEHNSIWHLLLSLFPMNGQMWPRQFGVTRKLLMAMSGFAILILSSLYQAKLAEELMLPYPPPAVTLKNLENNVVSGKMKLLLPNENTSLIQYISLVSPILSKSIETSRPIYEANMNRVLDAIYEHNALYISL